MKRRDSLHKHPASYTTMYAFSLIRWMKSPFVDTIRLFRPARIVFDAYPSGKVGTENILDKLRAQGANAKRYVSGHSFVGCLGTDALT